MKRLFVFAILLFGFSLYSSELKIYNDKCVYSPDRPESFVGFNSDVKVFCDNYKLPLYKGESVKGKSPLKNLFNSYLKLSDNLQLVSEKKAILEKVFNSIKFGSNQSVAVFLKNIDVYAKSLAETKKKERVLKDKIAEIKGKMNRMAPASFPYYCQLPEKFKSVYYEFKGIDYKLKNKLIFNEKLKNVKVIKEISLKNASGIDIYADKLYILNIYSKRYFAPIDFNPWIIRERVYRAMKTASKGLSEEDMLGAVPATAPVPRRAVQTESRVYLIENVNLFSDGIEKNYKVKEETVPYTKRLTVYPYFDNKVYNEYTFKLPFEVDTHYWEAYVGKKVFSSVKGVFSKKENLYRVFAGIDYSINVSRKRDLNFKEEKGFFNKKKVVKDGYELIFRNLSDKVKNLTVVDRVPVSRKEEIVVRDVKVTGIGSYNIDKKGKLLFDIELKAGEVKKVKVSFVIEYPEDQEIFY